MLDHIGLQVRDVEASLEFYLRTFAAIGMREAMRFPYSDTIVAGLSDPGGVPAFWLGPPTAEETRELHIAFTAPDRAAVEAVHHG
jgi:catechol 2,3-dioxygenase-like lactoylglutathione lyase family enzyme